MESIIYPDLLEPILRLLHKHMELGSKTILYNVRAHRGLALNEIADQQADKGHISNVWIGEVRGGELEDDLFCTKLDQEGVATMRKGDHLLP